MKFHLVTLLTLILATNARAGHPIRIPGTSLSVDSSQLTTAQLAELEAAGKAEEARAAAEKEAAEADVAWHESRFRAWLLSIHGPWYRRLGVGGAKKFNIEFLRWLKHEIPDAELWSKMPDPEAEAKR